MKTPFNNNLPTQTNDVMVNPENPDSNQRLLVRNFHRRFREVLVFCGIFPLNISSSTPVSLYLLNTNSIISFCLLSSMEKIVACAAATLASLVIVLLCLNLLHLISLIVFRQ
jgi:hypothetical protein